MMEALAFAREIGTPLLAHARIYWAGPHAGDDPDGRHFARVREGFDKWLQRQDIPGGLSAIWVGERMSRGSADVEHCHLLFHLPPTGARNTRRLTPRYVALSSATATAYTATSRWTSESIQTLTGVI